MIIKIDKTFMWVLLCSLLFTNAVYMWGRHIGNSEYKAPIPPVYIIQARDDTHNDEQIEIMRIQIDQLGRINDFK